MLKPDILSKLSDYKSTHTFWPIRFENLKHYRALLLVHMYLSLFKNVIIAEANYNVS